MELLDSPQATKYESSAAVQEPQSYKIQINEQYEWLEGQFIEYLIPQRPLPGDRALS